MKKDIQDALLSVGEIAVFVWSLLELLLTRILPLAGVVAGHLLLQFCRLLGSAVFRGRIEPQAEHSYDVHAEELIKDVHAEELIKEDNVQVDGDNQNDIESLKSSNKLEDGDHHLGSLKSSNNLEEGQEISREESLSTVPSLTHDEDADVQQAAAMPAAATELVDDQVHLAELAPSDEQMIDLHTSDAATNEVQVRGSDMADIGANVVGEEQKHVSAKGEDNGDRMDLEPSDVQTSEEAKASTLEGEMRKSRRMIRVLPPSLSQIKRTLMQRSRRGGSGSTPSPLKKKYNISPRTRKVSSSAIKSSPSYDNFMGKFRKHFLLDRA